MHIVFDKILAYTCFMLYIEGSNMRIICCQSTTKYFLNPNIGLLKQNLCFSFSVLIACDLTVPLKRALHKLYNRFLFLMYNLCREWQTHMMRREDRILRVESLQLHNMLYIHIPKIVCWNLSELCDECHSTFCLNSR